MMLILCFALSATAERVSDKFSIKAFREAKSLSGGAACVRGALWVDNKTDTYYLSDDLERPSRQIFAFDRALAGFNSGMYSAVVLPNDDVLFVYRTELGSSSTTEPTDDVRRNPIIYEAANGYQPRVIDFGDNIKPSGWLQNVGVVYDYDDNALFIAEYTRANLPTARCWRVDQPVTDPSNWHITLEHEIIHPYGKGFKHFHTAQSDPYGNAFYYTSGDDDTSSGIWASTDGGQTFSQLGTFNRRQWRMLNMVFTPEYIYWASDDWADTSPNHALWRARRDSAGVLDPNSLVELYNFRNLDKSLIVDVNRYLRLATYSTVYLQKYNALMMLDRDDDGVHSGIQLRVYDIDTDSMYIAATVTPTRSNSLWGFRCEAVELYPTGNEVVISFGRNYENRINVLGNAGGGVLNQVNTMRIRLIKDARGYRADFLPIGVDPAPVECNPSAAGGTVVCKNAAGDVINQAFEEDVVTVEVTPAEGYYAENANISVELTINPANAQSPDQHIGRYVPVQGDTPATAQSPAEYTFVMPANGFGVYVDVDFQPCADIGQAVVSDIPDQIYTGEAVTPHVTVSFGDMVLVEGVDYDITYLRNIDVGTATVIVTGKGKYRGDITTGFHIVSPPLRGDINLDGTVDIADLNLLLSMIMGIESPEAYGGRADLNYDGKVDIADLNELVSILLSRHK